MKRAVVLLSGGLDSTTCLAIANAEYDECYALSFDYGQKHGVELQRAQQIAKHYRVAAHKIVNLSIGDFGGSALTDAMIEVPDYQASDAIPLTYVPARNTVFLSIALGLAEVVNADAIYIGVSVVDYSSYPDCRPEYITAFQAMADLATKRAVEGVPIAIKAPLIYLSKAQTIAKGMALNVDYSMTVSCYRADANGFACGNCDSCMLRKKGFQEAGIADPTKYI